MNAQTIKQLFMNYIDGKHDEEYHSKEALETEDKLEECIERYIKNEDIYTEIMGKAFDTVLMYEQDGFIAGFKLAFNLAKEVQD